MPLSDLNLVRAHESTCRAEFSILDAVTARRDLEQNRDNLSNTLGHIGTAIAHTQAALEHLKTERDQLASLLKI